MRLNESGHRQEVFESGSIFSHRATIIQRVACVSLVPGVGCYQPAWNIDNGSWQCAAATDVQQQVACIAAGAAVYK